MVVLGLGSWIRFLGLGFSGGFQMMGFGACGMGPSGFFCGWGSLYKYGRITLGKNFALMTCTG